MLPARTISVSIARPWTDVYEAIWRPETFPRWATGLSTSELTREDAGEGEIWRAVGPDGEVRFTARNAFGVMDHSVELGDGRVIEVPMRVVQNGSGAEVMLTLFRQPDMSDERFAQDAEWVGRDLAALRDFVTGARPAEG